MAVGLHAVNKARLSPDDAVLVLGCGPVGLAVITALKQRGVAPVFAADYSPRRRRLALGQGADAVVDPRVESPYQYSELRRSENVVIFECIGVPGVIDQVFLAAPRKRAHRGGRRVSRNGSQPAADRDQQGIVGAVRARLHPQRVRRNRCKRIAEGSFNVAPLITGRVGLDDVAGAFEALRDPEQHAKILVEPWRV
jgi:threonine dehydrogenase-like Zn-dependent dehydrogenase